MNCADWEERIALYAGGDAGPAEAAAVEQHLTECAACRAFAAEVRQSMETLGDADLAAVRAGVLAEIAAAHRARRRWIWAGAMAAVAAAAALVIILAAPIAKPAPVPMVHLQLPPAPVMQMPEIAPVRRAAVVRVRHRTRQPAAIRPAMQPKAQPLVVKLVTDDPNVVIYWITGKSGE